METGPIVVHGLIDPNGILKLDQPLNLPPGEVQVTIQVVEPLSRPENSIWDVMERIWADHKANGFVPRSREDIDAERNAFREEMEDDFSRIEVLQKECENITHFPKAAPEQGM